MQLNILTVIKNAMERGHERVKVPYSKFNLAVIETLQRAGYINEAVKKGRGVRKIVDIKIKYKNNESPISGLRLISKPSRRIYTNYRDIKKSKNGYGHYVLSTPKGLLTDAEARKNKVGGELLFEIW